MLKHKRIWWILVLLPLLLSTLACRLLIPDSQPSAEPVSDQIRFTEISAAPDQYTMIRVDGSGQDLADLLASQAALAQQAGRRPFVDFYADWCQPCRELDKSLDDPAMVEAFAGTYIIRLDYDTWKTALPRAGFLVPGIPAFYEIDGQGKPTGRSVTGAAWGENIAANMAPPLKDFFQK